MPKSSTSVASFGAGGMHHTGGIIATNGAGVPTIRKGLEGCKLARGAGVGDYVLTLDDVYDDVDQFNVTVANLLPNLVRESTFTRRPAGGGNSTIAFTTFNNATPGAAVDIAAGANNILRCRFVLRTSSAKT